MVFIICLVVILYFSLIMLALKKRNEKVNQLRTYEQIRLGMSESEMLMIMGGGYNRSLLKNGRKKYEWRINSSSYSAYYKGTSSRVYSGVKKVDIYTKDGYVEEVKPYNV